MTYDDQVLRFFARLPAGTRAELLHVACDVTCRRRGPCNQSPTDCEEGHLWEYVDSLMQDAGATCRVDHDPIEHEGEPGEW